MGLYVCGLQDIDKTKRPAFGGKGANLGELTRIEGINVPEGFCISTEAYGRVLIENPSIQKLIGELTHLTVENRQQIRKLSGEICRMIGETNIPPDICGEIAGFLSVYGEDMAYAVRSSATAEDLPAASFAGQQDTYLNIIGRDAILKCIAKCWGSLFTERAVIYRIQNGFDHEAVRISVIVQKMVFPQAAGVMFTADPLTSNRKVLSVEACFGLGEALVSGLVNGDVYKVRDGKVLDKKISAKAAVIEGAEGGGAIETGRQNMQVLTEAQILQLAGIGRKIEQHFGCPQDIEWGLAGGIFHMLQSRPITALYPVPEAEDRKKHVYISVGHQQMMTDPMKPLGLSLFQLTSFGPRFQAGGRLFVDVIDTLAAPESRRMLLDVWGHNDPLVTDALRAVLAREDLIQPLPEDNQGQDTIKSMNVEASQAQMESDPDIVPRLMQRTQLSIKGLEQNIANKSGTALLDFILEDLEELKKLLFDPQSMAVIMAAMDASAWINEKIYLWLNEKNAADILSQSVPHNITSEMGLALLDVADAFRPYPALVDYLAHAKGESFLDGLRQFDGGQEVWAAVTGFLNKYGMRCVGEIDITKTRWSENPAILAPMILSNIKNFGPGAGKEKFEQGLQEAMNKEQELLARLRQLPGGAQKAHETKTRIDAIRNFSGYREYPKYGIVSRYYLYKQALIKEGGHLVKVGAINEKEDIYYLTFEELRETISTKKQEGSLIDKRKEEHSLFEKLTPPRVITSEGEIISGKYKKEHIPAGAIPGLPVSSGVTEGRARVILNMEDADLGPEDILVTSFTDPSWTTLFVSVKGLVTEVGGLMTHGAVIAREYGLPAVVGVENATKLIKDGQRIRVHGTEGYVEIL